MLMRLIGAVLPMLLLVGCATVSTGARQSATQGIAYHLPKGKFQLTVTEAGGVVSVLLGGPVMVPDSDFPMVARIPRGNLADNNVQVSVDDKTTLLKKVEVTSTGRVTDIATNLAKVIALQSSVEKTGVGIFDKAFDLDRLDEAASQANQALQMYYGARCAMRTAAALPLSTDLVAAGYTKEAAAKEISDRLLRCRQLALAGAPTAAADALISVAVTKPAGLGSDRATAATTMAGAQAGCARGVCYRPLSPVEITLKVKGAFERSDVLLVPDEATTLFVDLMGGTFATQKYTLDFTDGVLTSYKQDGQSELVGLVSLPIKVLTAVLSAPAEALGLRQKNLEAETNYLAAVDKAAAARETTAALCAQSPALCPGTAYRIIGGAVISEARAAGTTGPVTDRDNVP